MSGLETERECIVCCFGDGKLLASLQLYYLFLRFFCRFGRTPTYEVTQASRLYLLKVSYLVFTHLHLQITTTWLLGPGSFKNGTSAKIKLVAIKSGLS